MIIYGASLSPFVRKVLAVAAEKGIAVESNQAVGLGSRDPDFLAASPFRKIPALRDGDYTLCDSSAIIAYMEAVKPDPAMIPAEAKARGKVVWFDEFADTILVGAAGKMFFNRIVSPRFLGRPGDLAAADTAETEELPPMLAYLEASVQDNGHLVGDGITLADISVASFFLNLEHAGYRLDAAAYPRLAAFVTTMLARPSFAAIAAAERKALAA